TRPPDMITPTRTGKDYEITLGLKAVGDYSVKADMGLVSGLTIPWRFTGGTRPPPGGGSPEHHGSRIQQACGYSFAGDDQDGQYLNGAGGASADQALVPILSDGTARIPSLPLRVSPSQYEASLCISSEAPDATSPLDRFGRKLGKAITPLVEPREIYEKLF